MGTFHITRPIGADRLVAEVVCNGAGMGDDGLAAGAITGVIRKE